MIFLLIHELTRWGIHVPSVFEYTTTRMSLAAVTALVFSIFLGPYFIRKLYELKIGQTIRTEDCPLLGQLHRKKQDTPTMGGILIITSMLLALLLWMDFSCIFTWILLFATLTLGYLGGRDDYLKLKYKNTKGLSAKKKLLYQTAIAAFVACYMMIAPFSQAVGDWTGILPPSIKIEQREKVNIDPLFAGKDEKPTASAQISLSLQDFATRVYIPFLKGPLLILNEWWGWIVAFLLILFVIVGSSNSVNLTDGLDGLAAGCLTLVAGALALVAFVSNNIDLAYYLNIPYVEGSGEIAVYLSALVGACLGFLWYNAHPAQVFMGDVGSLTLGGIIGVSAVLLQRQALLGLVGGIFVAEAVSVILQVGSFKLRNKKRIFLCTPLHHHFEYQGWAETKVVIRFWIIGLLLAIIGIVSLKFQ